MGVCSPAAAMTGQCGCGPSRIYALVKGLCSGSTLWESPTCRSLATLLGHTGEVRAVALSNDGRLLATGGYDGTIRLWESASRELIATLEGQTSGIWSLALSGDGRLLASSGFDGTVRLWEGRGGTCLRTLRSDRGYERVDITGLTGVTAAQRAALLALGAVEHKDAAARKLCDAGLHKNRP